MLIILVKFLCDIFYEHIKHILLELFSYFSLADETCTVSIVKGILPILFLDFSVAYEIITT